MIIINNDDDDDDGLETQNSKIPKFIAHVAKPTKIPKGVPRLSQPSAAI